MADIKELIRQVPCKNCARYKTSDCEYNICIRCVLENKPAQHCIGVNECKTAWITEEKYRQCFVAGDWDI